MRNFIYIFIFTLCESSVFSQRLFSSDTIMACLSDSLYLNISKTFSKYASIKWLTPYASIYNTRKLNATRSPGKYVVTVTDNGKTIKDSTFVVFFPKPVFSIKDTSVCWGRKFTYSLQLNPMYSIKWSNGDEGPAFTCRTGGTYWVEASVGGCRHRDTFKVNYLMTEEKFLPQEVKFCMSDEAKILQVIKPESKVTYEWSNGTVGPVTRVNNEGMISVKAYHPVCGYKKDSVLVKFKACDCEILIPNSFSPNDDNRNDFFFPVLQCEYASYQLTIFDKFGNVLFHTNNPSAKWDGKYKGIPCEEDIYIYKLETVERVGDRKQVRNGRISLIR
ncbi:MAG: gliding motility-associated C-terminal domain-containing protein [Bacteroidia bacterium]|nr:gliding motility-associated C-terminal domain-containing protein [Bacteroidia bacterium]